MTVQPSPESLKQTLQDKGVKYALAGYVDIHGIIKGKFVPIAHIGRMLKGSELFTGAALDGVPQDIADNEVAAIATDTWGMEVRPNETADVFQPLHLIFIAKMGLWVGEIFDLDPIAADCAQDGVYEFLFCGPPLPFTYAVGSPLNPIAIK